MPAINSTPRVVRAVGDTRRHRTSYHWVSFRRTGDQIACKGDLAVDFLTCAALDPSVVAFSTDATPLQWFDGKGWQAHSPRFAVVRRKPGSSVVGMSYVDVEWSRTVSQNGAKYGRLRAAAAERHLSYQVLDEHEVRAEPRLTNARIVQSQAGPGIVPGVDADALAEFVRGRSAFTVREVVERTTLDHDRAYTAVLNRVALGDFAIDLGVRFDASQIVLNRSA